MTRRPVPVFAASLAAGILFIYIIFEKLSVSSEMLSYSITYKAAAWIVMGAALFWYMKDHHAIRMSAFLFFVAGALLMTASVTFPVPLPAESAVVKGTVLDVHGYDNRTTFLVDTGAGGRVLVTSYEVPAEAEDACGRQVLVSGSLEQAKSRTNPGCFDYRLYLRGRKVVSVMTMKSMEKGEIKRPLLRRIAFFRASVEEKAKAEMSEEGAALFSAMLFGDRSGLDDDVYESFRKNGTAHILAVSGLHVGMIYALLAGLLGGRRRVWKSIAALSVLGCYTVMAGCAPSIVRAVVMIALHIISCLIHRKYDMLSAASAAALLMLMYEPYALFSSGFQMSFLAIGSIAFLFPLLERRKPAVPKSGFKESVIKVAAPSLILQISTAPYTAYVFNCFSAGAFIANVPVIFLAGIIVPSGAAVMMLVPVSAFLASIAMRFTDLTCGLLLRSNDFFYHEGLTSFDVESPPLVLVLIYYAVLFGVSSEWFRIRAVRKEKGKMAFCILVTSLCILLISAPFGNSFLDRECVFVDVGQGACVHLRASGDTDVLIDGGGRPSIGGEDSYDVGKKILKPYLLKNGAGDVDLALVTHLDADHYQGIVSIARDGMVKKIAVHECLKDERERIAMDTGMDRKDIILLKTGEVIKAGDASFEILGPVGSGSSENGNSLIVRCDRPKGRKGSILIMGDADEEEETSLIAAYSGSGKLRCDVMQVAHHGSRYASTDAFLGAVRPKDAIIQVGKNMYGHPADETLERLKAQGARIWRNDKDGAVGVDPDRDDGRWIMTMRKGAISNAVQGKD